MKGQQGFLPAYCEREGFLLVLHPLDGIPHLEQSKDMREGHNSSSTAGDAPASHGAKAATVAGAQWGCAAFAAARTQLPPDANTLWTAVTRDRIQLGHPLPHCYRLRRPGICRDPARERAEGGSEVWGWFVPLCTEPRGSRSTGMGETGSGGGHSTARDSQAGRSWTATRLFTESAALTHPGAASSGTQATTECWAQGQCPGRGLRASIAWGPQPGANYSSRPTILALKQPYLAHQIYVISVGCFVIAAR